MNSDENRKAEAEALKPRQSKPLRFGSRNQPKKKKRRKRK